MIDLNTLTPEQIKNLQDQFEVVLERVDLRRYLDKACPLHWVRHSFGYRTSNSMIILTIDAVTSGRWCFDGGEEMIAFEDEADMTMFMLAYIEPEFKPARLV